MTNPALEKKLRLIDRLIEWNLIGLVLILPVANTETVRAVFEITPFVLWGVKMYMERTWLVEKTPLDIPLLLFFITIIISLFTSLKLSASIRTLRTEFITCAMVYYTVTNNIKDEKSARRLVGALIIGSVFMAAYAALDLITSPKDIFDIFSYRAGSLHQGYEAYAQYIIMAMPFIAVGFFYADKKWTKAALFGAFVLNSVVLYFTYTRGAWAALAVEMILVALLLPKRTIWKAVSVAVIVGGICGGFALLSEQTLWHGGGGIEHSTKEEMNTVEIRLKVWRGFVREFSKNPFLPAGYGKANFKRRFSGKEFMDFEQAHNTFINVATQLGAQGLVALFIIICVILWAAWKTSRRVGAFTRHYSLAFIVMTVGFFTANQFAEFYIDDTALMFWLFTGVLISIYNMPKSLERETD